VRVFACVCVRACWSASWVPMSARRSMGTTHTHVRVGVASKEMGAVGFRSVAREGIVG
jgi:hypothetical protein